MSVEQCSIEYSLACRYLASMFDKDFPEKACKTAAVKSLVGQGFSESHSIAVVDAAWSNLFD